MGIGATIGNIRYEIPELHDMTVALYIGVMEALEKDNDMVVVSKLFRIKMKILKKLPPSEFEKLVILSKRWLEYPTIAPIEHIEFMPLGSYPYGQYADWVQALRMHKDFRAIPYTIALLNPSGSLGDRQGKLLQEAFELPAHVGIYYHNKMINELQMLRETFVTLEGKPPTELELKAGIEHVTRYGEYMTMVNLSGGDIVKIREIARLPVNEVLTYVSASKDLTTYKEELRILKNNQMQK